jgi:N-acetylgalactosamine PTS system EIIA component
MSELGASRVRAIVAGHGDFAAGMVSAVEQITGRGAALHAVSARDMSAAQLESAILTEIDSTGATVVFTDLQAGSCTMATRRVARERPNVFLVAGVNLPMLIDFVFAENSTDVEAARHAVERGRSAICAIGGGAPGGSPAK